MNKYKDDVFGKLIAQLPFERTDEDRCHDAILMPTVFSIESQKPEIVEHIRTTMFGLACSFAYGSHSESGVLPPPTRLKDLYPILLRNIKDDPEIDRLLAAYGQTLSDELWILYNSQVAEFYFRVASKAREAKNVQ